MPWYHDTVASLIQRLEGPGQNALFSVFPVVVEDEVHGNACNFVLAGAQAAGFVSVDEVGDGLLLLGREAVGGGLLAKIFDRLPDHLDGGIMIP